MGPRFSFLVHKAVADLTHRPLTVVIGLATVALSGFYLLVLGAIGVDLYANQAEVLDAVVPTRIVATPRDPDDPRLRFSAERVAELGRLPGVRIVAPLVELNVEVRLAAKPWGDGGSLVPLRGIAPGEPVLDVAGLTRGRAPLGGALEAVMPESLFVHLGGDPAALGAGPVGLRLELARTTEGRRELLRLALDVVGSTRAARDELVMVPLDLALRLDAWAVHDIETIDRMDTSSEPPAIGVDLILHPMLEERAATETRREGWVLRPMPACGLWPDPDAEGLPRVRMTAADHSLKPVGEFLAPWPAGGLVLAMEPVIGAVGEWEGRSHVFRGPAADTGGLLQGRWPEAGSRTEVVLPAVSTLEVGERVPVTFRRSEEAEALTLGLNVVGLHIAPDACVSGALAADLARWQAGLLDLQGDGSQGFWSRPRGVVYAEDPETVSDLAARLRSLGYATEDHSGEFAALDHLADVIVALVVFMAAAALINGAASILAITSQRISRSVHEIGILKGLGLTGWHIVAIYAIQGVLIGLGAFALALFVFLAADDSLRMMASDALSLPKGEGDAWTLCIASWWLPALSLAVCVVFATLGTGLPAVLAGRLRPADAIRLRD